MERIGRWMLGAALVLAAGPAWTEAVSFSDLARHAEYSDLQISPDGQHVAAKAVVDGKPVLAIVDLVTHKGVVVKPREGNQVYRLWWASNQRIIYDETTDLAGWDAPFATGELFGVNADGTGAKLLFGYRAGGSSIATHIRHPQSELASAEVVDTLPGDDRHVLVGVSSWYSYKDGAFTQLNVMNVMDGTTRPAGTAPVRDASFVVDHRGVARFAIGDDAHAHRQVYYRTGESQPWKLLFDAPLGSFAPTPLVFSGDDRLVYMDCAAPGKVDALCPWKVDGEAMQPAVWSSDTVELYRLIRSLDHKDLVGVASMPGLPVVQAIAPHADSIALIGSLSRALPGESVSIESTSEDGGKAILLASSDMDPGTYYLWDRKSGQTTPLLKSRSWINPNRMAEMQPVSFKARDGLTIHGYLSTPPGQEQAHHLPMVVFVHGGPFGIRDWWGFDPYVQMLATHGYAVLQVNYRGSGGYGGAFQVAGYRQWGGAMQDDVTDATKWAIAQGIADAGRICIFGGSYGGYAALEGVAKEPGLYRCAIGYVGVYDLAKLERWSDATDSSAGESFFRGVLGSDSAKLAAISPDTQAAQIKARVMLVVGGQDTRVPPDQGRAMRAALQKAGNEPEWLYEPGEGHGFYGEDHRASLFQKVVGFLDRNIGSAAAGATKPH